MQTIRIASLLAFGLALTACPKKEENDQSAFSKTQPTAATSQPAQAATSQPAQAASQPAQAAHGETADAPPFAGEIKLATGLTADVVKPSDVLFVIARQSASGQPGQIIATQRHSPVTLPLKFNISRRDTMGEGIPFTGPFIVTARLDRDGDPMTKDENDLYAVVAGEVKGGQSDVALVLSKGMPQPAQPAQPASQPAR